MNFQQRDLVLLPVPFSDQSSRKVRPAIIVSNNKLNTSSEDLLLVPITSVLIEKSFSVLITQESLAEGKLLVVSRARADKIFPAEKTVIKMKIGSIKPEVLSSIRKEVMNAL